MQVQIITFYSFTLELSAKRCARFELPIRYLNSPLLSHVDNFRLSFAVSIAVSRGSVIILLPEYCACPRGLVPNAVRSKYI